MVKKQNYNITICTFIKIFTLHQLILGDMVGIIVTILLRIFLEIDIHHDLANVGKVTCKIIKMKFKEHGYTLHETKLFQLDWNH